MQPDRSPISRDRRPERRSGRRIRAADGWSAMAAAVTLLASASATSLPANREGKDDEAGAGWSELPSYPQAPGMGGIIAGVDQGVLIAAGGANFPDRPPWEGGKKRTYDSIYVLPPGGRAWVPAGQLPEPRAYAGVISIADGVLAVGGENGARIFGDSVLLRWERQQVRCATVAALPAPVTCPAVALLAGKVYLAGGYAADGSRTSCRNFWCLDLADRAAGWRVLPTWPGPARGQAVMAAVGDAVYLVSGLDTTPDKDGRPRSICLTDAYRYRPGHGWEQLPDPPWSAVAAPTPAPVTTVPQRVFVLGGVDGRLEGKQPRDTRVPDRILCFDVETGRWRTLKGKWPDPVVTTPSVQVGDDWIFISGEIMAGVRTTHVGAWNLPSAADGKPPAN
ncbi:MAG: hypothetical protein HYV75_00390 [Opitutae bacterium]|nr:hypothetical protein [Opitutae bacterium]